MVFAMLNVLVGNVRGGELLRDRHLEWSGFLAGIGRAAPKRVRPARTIGVAPAAGMTKFACRLARGIVFSCGASSAQAPVVVWGHEGVETLVGDIFAARLSAATPTWARP